ncbi:MAG: LCP family protein [Bacillota bacterium]
MGRRGMDEKERQYQEYLALRQHEQEEEINREYFSNDDKYGQFFPDDRKKTRRISVTETPYGASEMRKAQKEKERRDREMQDYLAAREADWDRRGVRSGVRHSDHDGYSGKKKSRKSRKRRSGSPLMVIAIVFVLAAVLAVAGAGMLFMTVASAEHISIDKNDIGINDGVAASLDGYRNIAVLGTDARKGDDESNVRSDAIIVASINEETNEVKMFSVFRDTLLDVGDGTLDKVTHAYAYGGAQQSLKTLNKNLDLDIDEVVVINWKTVADTIDAVGGIEIDVQESELEELNKYIPNTAKNVDGPKDKVESAGKQTLNGVQAVTYARIRKDAVTGDYRRNERMKIVFSETFKKIKHSGPLKMLSVARHAMPEVKTNIGTGSIIRLMLHVKSYDMTDSTTGFPYDVGSWTGYAGAGYAWYGPPINLANNVSKLHGQFFNQDGYDPTETVYEISNSISYLTGIY